MKIELVGVAGLRHIENFSPKRVAWLREKITREDRWIRPLALDDAHGLVLDGQHRMEVAKALGLQVVPAVRFSYADVEVWSLRPQYAFTWREVVEKALGEDIYPYKTVKHGFGEPIPACDYLLDELR